MFMNTTHFWKIVDSDDPPKTNFFPTYTTKVNLL